jgi:hypothetical protein
MSQYDVMYIDDGRNADHRVPARYSSRPSSPTAVVPPSQRPTVIYSRPNAPAAAYGAPYPASYATPQVVYGPPTSFASRFGMSTGELIDSAIQILAAIQPLPAAPVAQGESGLDVENLVTYQGALATHAKRDEQLRTLGALVGKLDLDARIEERQLTQALGQNVVVKLGVGEYRRARMEADGRAAPARRADDLQRILRLAELVFLAMLVAVAIDRQRQMIRQRVDDRHADAVQPAGNLVAVVVEFAAGVEHRHHDFGRRAPFFGLDADRDAAPVVDHADRAVAVDRHLDVIAESGQRLVDRVVDDFENHVMQTGSIIGVADVHARPLANGLESLQDLDFTGIVLIGHGFPGCAKGIAGGAACRCPDESLIIAVCPRGLVPRGTARP